MTTLELDVFIGLFKWVLPSATSMLLFAKSFAHLFLFISAPFTHSFTSFLDLPFCKPLSLHLYNVLFSHWNFFITPLSSSLSYCFCVFLCFLLSQQTHKRCKSPYKGARETHFSSTTCNNCVQFSFQETNGATISKMCKESKDSKIDT